MKVSFAKMFAAMLMTFALQRKRTFGRGTSLKRSRAPGSAGQPGSKMARLAAERRLGMPSGRPGPG